MADLTVETFNMDAGTKLLMDLTGASVRLYSFFVGMIRGKYILTQIPASNEFNKEQVFQFLYPQNKVTVRYIQDGSALGFSCELIKYIMAPFPLLFLSFPTRIEAFELRKHRRLNCLFQSTALIAGHLFKGMITDLSTGGCQVIVPTNGHTPQFGIDDVISLQCTALLSENGTAIQGKVMRVQKNGPRYSIGLKFQPLAPPVARQIEGFLSDAQLCLM